MKTDRMVIIEVLGGMADDLQVPNLED